MAGAGGAGQIRGGALEMSNVDLSREFIGLISASTAFQANSRVISTSNEMLDQLLLALR
jgi:flagellar hook protein FlgE